MPLSSCMQVLVAGLVCLCAVASGLFAVDIEVPLKGHDINLFTDKGSHSGACAAANILADQGAIFSINSPALPPGVYIAHVRLKVSHTVSRHTARVRYALAAKSGEDELGGCTGTILDFEQPGVYRDFTFPFSVRRAKAVVTLSAVWQWHAAGLERRPSAEVVLPKIGEEDSQEEELKLEHDLNEIEYHIASNRIWVERIGDVEVRGLAVDKLRYRPGDKARIAGVVVNYADTPRALELVTLLIQDMDNRETLDTRSLIVGPRGEQEFVVEGSLTNRLWGQEVLCLVQEKGIEVARASECFTVHTNPWAVAIGAKTVNGTRGVTPEGARQRAAAAKAAYANQVEFVFWAPDDFGCLVPEENEYWGGQMRFPHSAKGTKALIDAFHKAGVACAMYATLDRSGGKAGYELLRRHPDWASPEFYDVAQLDRWDRSAGMMAWPRTQVRRDIDEPFRHHAGEIIGSVRAFGWDIVRYDSTMLWPETPRILKLVKTTVNAAYPDFQWGYNDDVHRSENPPAGVYEMLCENGGMIMDEYNAQAGPEHWTYDKYTGRHIHFRDQTHRRGGHCVFIGFETTMPSECLYQKILPLAAQAHIAWDTGEDLEIRYNRFATRYAGYVWDNQSLPLTNATRWINIGAAGNALFKWPSYAYLRQREHQRSELILNLINAPAAERLNAGDDCAVPPPRRDIVVSVKVPDGLKVRDVWCATAEPELRQERLPFRRQDDTVAFTVAKLRFWNMIVVCLEGKGEW